MKTSKFTEGQIAFVLKQAEDGTPVAEVCRKAGIAEATFLQLAQALCGSDALGGTAAAPARGRDAKLKRIVADLSLDKAMLQDVLSKRL